MSKYRIGVLSALAVLLFSLPSFADSQIRIVRLSYVEGAVQVDRNTGLGFEKALLNLPIVNGSRLRTTGDGFAEVEFEDGSTLRLTSDTQVTFSRLELRDSGAKVSSVDLQQGSVYVSYTGAKDNEFTLAFGPETLALGAPAHLRLSVAGQKASLAVFKGEVHVDGPSGVAEASKKETLNFDLAGQGKYTLAKKVVESPYDSWDKDQDDYRQRYARNNAANASPNVYGLSDLNYYGNFVNIAGYGSMWQPFFAGAGWDPYSAGAFAWYPGSGYTWVSAYPWGWTPFHSGSWQFIPDFGWAWQPGGAFVGMNNIPRPVHAPAGFVAPQPPGTPTRSIVTVNRGLGAALNSNADGLVVRRNSAGLGIPRGSIQNLNRTSVRVQQQGFANTTFRNPPVAAMYNPAYGQGQAQRSGTPVSGLSRSGASGQGTASPAWSRANSGTRSAPSSSPGMSSHSTMGAAPAMHGGAAPSGGAHK